MNTLLISYDLGGPETSDSYKKLIDAIKNLGNNNCHPLESFWLVKTTCTAEDALNYLKGFIDANDLILVINVTSDQYS